MNTVIKNFTPHIINIFDGEASVTYPVDGPAPRLATVRTSLGFLAGHHVVRTAFGEITGLPPKEENVVLVVSAMVAEAAPERDDLAYPGEAVRDAGGKIVGATGLCAGPGLAARLLRK
jgi:hypothetical protein